MQESKKKNVERDNRMGRWCRFDDEDEAQCPNFKKQDCENLKACLFKAWVGQCMYLEEKE